MKAITEQEIVAATEPLGVEKSIDQLGEVYNWLSNLPLDDDNDLYALNAGIEALKLLRA